MFSFKAVCKSITEVRQRARNERTRKHKAEQLTQREALLLCDDEQLALRLRGLAETFQSHGGYSSGIAYKAAQKLLSGLEILHDRVKTDGLDQHPALAPIVRVLAAIPPNDQGKTMNKVTAVINATRENPWRSLADAPKRADHPAL